MELQAKVGKENGEENNEAVKGVAAKNQFNN